MVLCLCGSGLAMALYWGRKLEFSILTSSSGIVVTAGLSWNDAITPTLLQKKKNNRVGLAS